MPRTQKCRRVCVEPLSKLFKAEVQNDEQVDLCADIILYNALQEVPELAVPTLNSILLMLLLLC